jgi:hypothetical protein
MARFSHPSLSYPLHSQELRLVEPEGGLAPALHIACAQEARFQGVVSSEKDQKGGKMVLTGFHRLAIGLLFRSMNFLNNRSQTGHPRRNRWDCVRIWGRRGEGPWP